MERSVATKIVNYSCKLEIVNSKLLISKNGWWFCNVYQNVVIKKTYFLKQNKTVAIKMGNVIAI